MHGQFNCLNGFHRGQLPYTRLTVTGDCSCLVDVIIITSLAKEVMFLVALHGLSVCLSVCGQHYSRNYERIGMKYPILIHGH